MNPTFGEGLRRGFRRVFYSTKILGGQESAISGAVRLEIGRKSPDLPKNRYKFRLIRGNSSTLRGTVKKMNVYGYIWISPAQERETAEQREIPRQQEQNAQKTEAQKSGQEQRRPTRRNELERNADARMSELERRADTRKNELEQNADARMSEQERRADTRKNELELNANAQKNGQEQRSDAIRKNEQEQRAAMRDSGVSDAKIFVDTTKSRPEYRALLKAVKKGDRIVLPELEALGATMQEILEQWQFLTEKKGVCLTILDMPALCTATGRGALDSLVSEIMTETLSYLIQKQKKLRHEQQIRGIQAAKSRGVRCGRAPREIPDNFEAVYAKWELGAISANQAAKALGVANRTFKKWAEAGAAEAT